MLAQGPLHRRCRANLYDATTSDDPHNFVSMLHLQQRAVVDLARAIFRPGVTAPLCRGGRLATAMAHG